MHTVTRPIRRRSTRDPEDLYVDGHYLITICTHRRRHTLGAIVDGVLVPSPLGALADDAWRQVIDRVPHAAADAFVLMPNHVHAVVVLDQPDLETRNVFGSLGWLVGRFKQRVTTSATELRYPTPVWQRGYHDRILRSDAAHQAAIEYVESNPNNWQQDPDSKTR